VSARRGVAILGSTGSIGTSALRVLRRQQERFAVRALTTNQAVEQLDAQVREFRPAYAGVTSLEAVRADESYARGPRCLVDAATRADVDVVLNAVVGAVGLDATLAALALGKRVALANKESLVVAGEIVMRAARDGGGEVVPVDSEHSAILQCIAGRPASEVRRLVLTASGGPFREWTRDELERATLADALQASDVADGPQDHRRQRVAREQGARGDRGAPPLRRAVRPHRRRRPPAERGALVRGVRGRQRDRSTGRAEHGAAHPYALTIPNAYQTTGYHRSIRWRSHR
jgi:hypothetical protein